MKRVSLLLLLATLLYQLGGFGTLLEQIGKHHHSNPAGESAAFCLVAEEEDSERNEIADWNSDLFYSVFAVLFFSPCQTSYSTALTAEDPGYHPVPIHLKNRVFRI